ncbi:DUF6985 domain-containing protein [Psychroserpens sp. S379A]|uniref:DUF6985 domain-containing protein n=1 Tax=Psychroserpens sp. S379A TaxID=3415137 RepID=UPI003C7A81F4
MNTQENNNKPFDIEGEVYLPAWKGFQSRKGIYGSKDSSAETDCVFDYVVGGDSTLILDKPKDYQYNAYNYVIENQETIKEIILVALLKKYPEIQNTYDYEPDEKEEIMPDISNINEFKTLIGLSRLHFVNVHKDNVGYVGFEFGCEWDDEHGLGIMTYMDRVIKIGGADCSFLQWVAEEDLSEKELEVLEKEQNLEFKKQQEEKIRLEEDFINNKVIKPYKEKKTHWWKFWK